MCLKQPGCACNFVTTMDETQISPKGLPSLAKTVVGAKSPSKQAQFAETSYGQMPSGITGTANQMHHALQKKAKAYSHTQP